MKNFNNLNNEELKKVWENNMNINFDTEFIAQRLCAMANLENETNETEKALYHLKAIAQNEYNQDYFRTLVKVLNAICDFDYLED